LDVLHNWLITQGIKEQNIDYNLCIYPQELDIRNLPQEYKDSVLDKYRTIKLPSVLINMVTNQLNSESNIDFIASSAFSRKLDEMRGEVNPIESLKVYMNNC
jgi:hypothetical protein